MAFVQGKGCRRPVRDHKLWVVAGWSIPEALGVKAQLCPALALALPALCGNTITSQC